MDSIKGQLLVLLIVATLSFVFIRWFLYGVKRYQLNNSAYKKRKSGESFVEWLLYKRYKKEIPKILMYLYFISILLHLLCALVCAFFWIIKKEQIGSFVVILAMCFDSVYILVLQVLFWSKKGGYAYEKWINKKKNHR